MKVCVITDNLYIYEHFIDLLRRKPQDAAFDFYCAPWNHAFREKFGEDGGMRPIRLREQGEDFFSAYDLFLSLHCKQLFPDKMVTEHTCINVHPGLNPYNRGWFPQVFGILRGMPVGVTIHLMDAELDHGPILWQRELTVGADETSKDVYERILATEMELMEEHLTDILTGNYTLTPMAGEGNVNTREDYEALLKIDLDKPATYGEVIDFLRAMTHPPYQNAYYYDADGRKVYIGVRLEKEK